MKERDVGLDITRIFAFLCVVSVHSLHYTGFYNLPVDGIRMYLLCLFRALVNCCIPLFLLISGYLLGGRIVDLREKGSLRRYLCQSGSLICTYFLAEVMNLTYRNVFLHESLSWRDAAAHVLGYSGYGWYVNMYLGLYVLLPFLNLLWRSLGDKSVQKKFLFCLFTLTALPGVANVYNYATPGALMSPWTYQATNSILPDWWTSLYPLTAFYLGAYIRENIDIAKLHTNKLLLLLFLCVLLCGGYNIWRSWKVPFVRGIWNSEGSLQTLLCAVLVFLTISSIHYPELTSRGAGFLRLASKLTFGAYLFSWTTDRIVSQILYRHFASAAAYTLCMPLTIAASAAMALSGAFLIQLVQKTLFSLFRRIQRPVVNA